MGAEWGDVIILEVKIFLIRHGQTTGDVEDRYGGDYDDHLTGEGRKQARELARKLSDKVIEVIFSSPKIRAEETAEILAQELAVNIEMIEDLRERNQYGALTGLTKTEAGEKYPALVEPVKDYKNTVEGAESYQDFKIRVSRALERIFNSGHNVVAIVTHGGPIRTVFREKLEYGEIDVEDCANVELEYETTGNLSILSLDGISLRA